MGLSDEQPTCQGAAEPNVALPGQGGRVVCCSMSEHGPHAPAIMACLLLQGRCRVVLLMVTHEGSVSHTFLQSCVLAGLCYSGTGLC